MRRRILRGVLLTLMLVCMVAALWFGYSYWLTMKEYERGEADLKEMYELIGSVPEPAALPDVFPEREETEAEEHAGRLESYLKLEQTNSDTIGWVRIEGTVIDYPVMHTPDNPDFYLDHGFDRQKSSYGMIYMDASCSLTEDCRNYLLYGHHMKNGSMFASLEEYTSEEYFKAHPIVGFDTLDSVCDYEIAAVLKLPASMLTTEFSRMLAAGTEENYAALIAFAKEHSFYETGITPEWPEQLLTLTTCEYTQKDGRLLVIARLAAEE